MVVLDILLVIEKVKLLNHYVLSYLKYIESGGKNMSFVIKDDYVLDKYNEIWDKIEKKLSIKFHNTLVHDEKYIRAKVREFNGVIKTNFLNDEVPKITNITLALPV